MTKSNVIPLMPSADDETSVRDGEHQQLGPPGPHSERLVDSATLARALGVHRTTVGRMARVGEIPFYRVRGQLRFSLAEVRRALHVEVSLNGDQRDEG